MLYVKIRHRPVALKGPVALWTKREFGDCGTGQTPGIRHRTPFNSRSTDREDSQQDAQHKLCRAKAPLEIFLLGQTRCGGICRP